MSRKEVIDDNIIVGINGGIKYAKQRIVDQLIHDKIAPKSTTIEDVEWVPFVGHKHSENLNNIGKVIGYRVKQVRGIHDPVKKLAAKYFELRVDYDHQKLAHINYKSTHTHSNFNRAVKIDIEDWRLRMRYNNNPEQAVLEAWEDLTRLHHMHPEVFNIPYEVHRVLVGQKYQLHHTTIATNPYRMQLMAPDAPILEVKHFEINKPD